MGCVNGGAAEKCRCLLESMVVIPYTGTVATSANEKLRYQLKLRE